MATMTETTRTVLLLAAALSLGACGSTELTARGDVVATFDGAMSGFTFEQDTRLETPERDASLGLITGDCEMGRVVGAGGEPAWGVVVDIRRGGAVGDLGLASVTIMQRTDSAPSDGRVEAEIGLSHFTSGAGACSVEIPYAEPDGGMVGLSADCEVSDADGNLATLTVNLDIIGCTVVE